MPELVEQMYCSQQIVIPPKFPYILKRYCKAAIKTQPYDLLRWSFEYFKALAERREPPVKLRLEYPVYSTEGGLTRGCLKVLAKQLSGMEVVPLPAVRAAWKGFCLDLNELKRILCLCEVYLRKEKVPFLHFIAVAGGLLTKSLTHTMILLCETLTKEPDGGSAAISLHDFLLMYQFLAVMDASKDVKYLNGYREGTEPPPPVEEQETEIVEEEETTETSCSDDFWEDKKHLQRLMLTGDHISKTSKLSTKMNMPILGKIERSPSVERAGQIERENYLRERKGRARSSQDIDDQLRTMSAAKMGNQEGAQDDKKPEDGKGTEKKEQKLEIFVFDEANKPIPYEIYGEPSAKIEDEEVIAESTEAVEMPETLEQTKDEEEEKTGDADEATKVAELIASLYEAKEERLNNLEATMDDIAAIVDRFKSANYDLGMVAGRQMSTTSGEFIVQHIEQEIMDFVNEQIAILPDPDLKKKKAKPEEVEMIHELLERFLDENMEIIVPEEEEVEEEETPIPEIIQVYAVPGIGPTVNEDIINDFVNYALEVSKVQAEVFMPRNIRHFMCPPLEKYEEYKYDEGKPKTGKEELATGGQFTD